MISWVGWGGGGLCNPNHSPHIMALWHLFGIFLMKRLQRVGLPKVCLLEATGQEDDHRGHQRHHLHHRQHHRRHQLHGHCAEDHLRTSVKGWAIHTNQKAMSKLSFFITAYILGMKGNEPNFGQTIYSSRFGQIWVKNIQYQNEKSKIENNNDCNDCIYW